MNNDWPIQDIEHNKPYLFSFSRLRPERFGALLFNPYLGIEEELDPIESFIASLCNGYNSCQQVESITKQHFGLHTHECRQYISQTVRKLLNAYLLGFRNSGQVDSPRLPKTHNFEAYEPYLSAPKNVIWDVTYACNLNCAHCLTSSGKAWKNELTTEEAMALIDSLEEAQVLYLSLSGGEPFLRHDILTLLHHMATTNMRVDIATNGVWMPDNILHSLRDLPIFQIQVSIDGIDQQHDRFRGLPGAFQATCNTVKRLQAEKIAVSVSTTVTSENVGDLDRIIDLTMKLGCSGFKAIPFLPAGRGRENVKRLQLNREGYQRFTETLVRRRRELEGKLHISTETCFSFLLESPPENSYANGPMGCSAGYDTLSIGADGTVYPCPFLHDFPLGNLMQQSLREIWQKAPVLERLRTLQKQDMNEPCKSCPYAPLICRGGCRAAAFFESGDLCSSDPTCFRQECNEIAGNGKICDRQSLLF